MNKLFFNCLHQFILCLHPIPRLLCNLNKILECICKYANIHYIFVSKKKYLLAVHNFWIFFSLLLPPRWIFQSIPKIFTSSQELFVGNLHIHRCCVFCWKTKRKGEKMKAFYGNINIKYTVIMRVQWSISSRFFFSRKICQSPYRLYWFSYTYENHN